MKLIQTLFLLICFIANSEDKPSALPFAIAEEKKIPQEELKEKKEGWFVTGLPQLSSDPVNGFGAGGDVYLYFNGDKSDPFFDYTAYRTKYELHLFATNKSQQALALGVDSPYIFNSKWRVRAEALFEDNPNLLYFGQTASTMGPLTYNGQSYSTYSAYENALSANPTFNDYRKEEMILNLSAERSMLDSTVRLVAGLELAKINVGSKQGLFTIHGI